MTAFLQNFFHCAAVLFSRPWRIDSAKSRTSFAGALEQPCTLIASARRVGHKILPFDKQERGRYRQTMRFSISRKINVPARSQKSETIQNRGLC